MASGQIAGDGESISPRNGSESRRQAVNRAVKACSSCNRQKVRCGGGQPCARCIAIGHGDRCEYLPSMRGKMRKRKARPGESEGPSRLSEVSDITDMPLPTDKSMQVEMPLAPPGTETSTIGAGSSTANHRAPQRHSTAREGDYLFWEKHRDANNTLDGSTTTNLWQGHDQTGSSLTVPTPASDSSIRINRLPLPDDAPNPLAVLAEASATTEHQSTPRSAQHGADEEVGYYAPVARVMRDEAPHVLSWISVQEAEHLFDIYFRSLHPHFPILDRLQSSPVQVARRSNFLFNAICCVAARGFHIAIWERLRNGFARFEMERLPKDICIEVVQGHLIYAQWNLTRPKHFEQDTTWLRIGLAVRTAIDVNLHRIALDPQAVKAMPKWSLRNVLRTWLSCYIVDRAVSSQLGKPPSVRGENAIRLYMNLITRDDIRETIEDVWVAALAEWTLTLSRSLDVLRSEAADHLSSLARNFSTQTSALPDIVRVFCRQSRKWREKSTATAATFKTPARAVDIVTTNFELYDEYAQLVIQSHVLQRANESASSDLPSAAIEYQNAAIRLISHFDEGYERRGFTRGCTDFMFTVLTYGAVSLFKVAAISVDGLDLQKPNVIDLARRAADILAQGSVTSDHLPASQHLLLSRLIARHTQIRNQPHAHQTSMSSSSTAPQQPQPFDFRTALQPQPQPDANMETISNDANFGDLGNIDLSSWFEPMHFNPIPPGPSSSMMDPFGQDQDLVFTHESLWGSLQDNGEEVGDLTGLGTQSKS